MEIFQMGSDLPPPYFSELWNRWGTFHIWWTYGFIWGSYWGHMGVIWASYEAYGGLKILWCHMGIILEAYGGYLKNVPQTYGKG